MKGELPYTDCLATLRILKLDKVVLNRFYVADSASIKNVVAILDIRTNQIVQVYTDEDYDAKQEREREGENSNNI
jgi:hypothetical protein